MAAWKRHFCGSQGAASPLWWLAGHFELQLADLRAGAFEFLDSVYAWGRLRVVVWLCERFRLGDMLSEAEWKKLEARRGW